MLNFPYFRVLFVFIIFTTANTYGQQNEIVCQYTSKDYSVGTSVSSSGDSYATYSWTVLPSASNATITNANTNKVTINWGKSNPDTYTLTVEKKTACSSESKTYKVKVLELPSLTGSDITSCNETKTFDIKTTGSNTGGTKATKYTWEWPDTANDPGNVENFSPTVIGEYEVKYTDSYGCESNKVTVKYTKPKVSANKVTSTPNQASNTYKFCNSGSIEMSLKKLSSPTNPLTYTWKITTTVSASASASATTSTTATTATSSDSATTKLKATQSGTYFVSVYDEKTECNTDTNTITLTINPNPTVTNIPATVGICSGTSKTFSPTITGATNYSSVWMLAGAKMSEIDSYSTSTAGTYTYTAKNTDTNCSTSVTSVVSVNPNPTAKIEGKDYFCAGSAEVPLSLEISSVNAKYEYQWINTSGDIASENNTTYTATAASTYSVRIKNTETGCTTTSDGKKIIQESLPVLSAITNF